MFYLLEQQMIKDQTLAVRLVLDIRWACTYLCFPSIHCLCDHASMSKVPYRGPERRTVLK